MEPGDEWRPLAEALLGKAEFTPLDVARETNFAIDELRLLWRALGFPPVPDEEPFFTRSDIEILRAVRQLTELQLTEPRSLLLLTRVTGQSVARIADAQVTDAAERFNRRGQDASPEAARAELIERIELLAGSFDQLLGYVWRRHLLAAVLRLSATPSAADRDLTVGFADMVGFTTLSQAIEGRELAYIVERFEATAYEHIPEHGGRVVKIIGDAVMFAVDDPPVAAQIALDLVDAYADDPALPDVRVGLACGRTLAWEGDLFGPTVNLASRLVNFARPRSVLVSDELGATLRDLPQFVVRRLQPVRLQGFGSVRIGVLRRRR
jgi:adenylate cyclase